MREELTADQLCDRIVELARESAHMAAVAEEIDAEGVAAVERLAEAEQTLSEIEGRQAAHAARHNRVAAALAAARIAHRAAVEKSRPERPHRAQAADERRDECCAGSMFDGSAAG